MHLFYIVQDALGWLVLACYSFFFIPKVFYRLLTSFAEITVNGGEGKR